MCWERPLNKPPQINNNPLFVASSSSLYAFTFTHSLNHSLTLNTLKNTSIITWMRANERLPSTHSTDRGTSISSVQQSAQCGMDAPVEAERSLPSFLLLLHSVRWCYFVLPTSLSNNTPQWCSSKRPQANKQRHLLLWQTLPLSYARHIQISPPDGVAAWTPLTDDWREILKREAINKDQLIRTTRSLSNSDKERKNFSECFRY